MLLRIKLDSECPNIKNINIDNVDISKEFSKKLHNTRIYEKISKDDRHVRALILSYEECHVRNFSKWNMKFLMLTEEQKELIRKYSISGIFNPYNMSGESCIHLLSELSNKYGTDEV
jgi:hypothetical protein